MRVVVYSSHESTEIVTDEQLAEGRRQLDRHRKAMVRSVYFPPEISYMPQLTTTMTCKNKLFPNKCLANKPPHDAFALPLHCLSGAIGTT